MKKLLAIITYALLVPSVVFGATYLVEKGDTLASIAKDYGVSVGAITGYKSGNPNVIQVGEKLNIATDMLGAGDGTIGTLDPWRVTSGVIVPRNSSSTLKVPSLGVAGNPCVTVSTDGLFSTQSCAGASSTAVTSINGEVGPAITIAAGTNVTVATSTNTITINATGGGGSGSISTSTAVTAGYFPTWGTTSALTGTSTAFLSGSNIGIGTTAPSSTLHVVGTFQVSASTTLNALTASTVPYLDASKILQSSAVTPTELGYLSGVTSAIQTQLGTKAPTTAPTFGTSITGSYLTASEMLITDGSKNIVSAPVATYPSLTELTYLKGVTSAVQTQINAKQAGDSTLTALASYNTNGILTQTAADTFTGRTLTGTSNRLSITNGDGVSGNPTFDISTSFVGQTAITTLGTITTGTWNAGVIPIAYGGTGTSTTPTALKLLTGNGIGYDLLTLTAGTGISVATSTTALTISSAITAGRSLTLTTADIAADAELYTNSFTIPFADPTSTTPYSTILHKLANNITLANISCRTDSGTTTMTFDKRSEGSESSTGTNVLTSLTCGTAFTSSTSFSASTLTAGQYFTAIASSTAGTPKMTSIWVKYTNDD